MAKEQEKITDKPHDKGYKKIFSIKKNFLDFMKKYIGLEWMMELTERDMELIDKEYITDQFDTYESDLVYKVNTKSGSIYLFFLFELQSYNDFTMPFRLFPEEALVEQCRAIAAGNGGHITLTEDVMEGTRGVDVVYTDVWVSMGEPDEVWTERIRELSPYQVNTAVMENAGKDAIFLHCLPAFHDLKTKIGAQMGQRFGITEMEVTDQVFESGQSLVFEEAENRMHTIKAVMYATLVSGDA